MRISISIVVALAGLAAPAPAAPPADPAPTKPATKLPHVVILATGGTIAGKAGGGGAAYGYTAGQVKASDLVMASPGIDKLARISTEQIANIGSQDMNDQVWLKLAKRSNELLASKDVDAIVITHGTDTMEETAYFLDLVVKSDKPVVLVGSMRPSTATSADGPANLYEAVAIAANRDARGRGVLVVLNDDVHCARNVTKTDTTSLQTFESPNRGPCGQIETNKINWFQKMDKRNTVRSEFSTKGHTELPRVDIIYAHSNMGDDLIKAAIANGAQGIIIAGVGDGNMSKAAIAALQEAAKRGIVVVRASRVAKGIVMRNAEVDDDKLGFVAAGELNPPKARVLVALALTKDVRDPKRVQKIFDEY